ncbi:MAG: aspartate/glutamate racemase family protein [Clostridiales Family XIII bacterium]|jgi:Asp/Glu/hydantoin racemase|nr:aspartate/glutamate racemase family protein [Clostridiales Family XIII bacterium]
MPKQDREYGYMTGLEEEAQWVSMPRGQNISGYGVGILYLDKVWYPMVPGNIVNAYTFDFPVRLKAVTGLDTPWLHSGDPAVFDVLLGAAKELAAEGVRAISAACGFFGHFQGRLAAAMDIPVAVSSLVQAPWIEILLGGKGRIGVLTANASAMSESLFASCGIAHPERLVVADLCHAPQFSAIMEDRGAFDNTEVRREVVSAAVGLLEEHPDIGAILLECSDMPPYAWAVQRATGLPVFDFTTLIRWLHGAVAQKPYAGWV